MKTNRCRFGGVFMLALAVAAALTLGTAATAWAGAAQLPLLRTDGLNTCYGAIGESPAGFVILNTNDQPGGAQYLSVLISVKDGEPNAAYAVHVWEGCPATSAPLVGTLTTNGQGHDTAYFTVPRDPGARSVFFELFTDDDDTLITKAVALD
jgi:hypothetical protein